MQTVPPLGVDFTVARVPQQLYTASLVGLKLETGRTHQIRVHMRFAGRPVLGDPVYGVTDFRGWYVPDGVRVAREGLQGQALHAERLGITHPTTGVSMTISVPGSASMAPSSSASASVSSRP